MNVGISTASYFGKYTVEDTIDVIAETGAKHIEVFLSSFSELNHIFVKKIRENADEKGISIDSVHPFGIQYELQLFASSERIADDSREIFRKVLEAGQILGAKYYVFHGGMYFKPKDKRPPNYHTIGKNIDLLCNMAKDYGISLAYENVYWCWYNYPEFADRLLNETKNDNLSFNLDVKQAVLSEKPVKDYVMHMGNRLKNVHISGLNIEKDEVSTCMPGRGNFDLKQVAEYLKEIKYDSNVLIEVYSKDFKENTEMKQSFEYLQGIFKG